MGLGMGWLDLTDGMGKECFFCPIFELSYKRQAQKKKHAGGGSAPSWEVAVVGTHVFVFELDRG